MLNLPTSLRATCHTHDASEGGIVIVSREDSGHVLSEHSYVPKAGDMRCGHCDAFSPLCAELRASPLLRHLAGAFLSRTGAEARGLAWTLSDSPADGAVVRAPSPPTQLYSYPTVLLPYCTLTLLYSYCTPTHSNRRQNVAFQSPPIPPLIALIVRARMNLTYHMSAGGGLYPCTHIPLHPSYERRRGTVPMYPCTHAPSYELRRKLVPMYPCTPAPLHPSYERRRRA